MRTDPGDVRALAVQLLSIHFPLPPLNLRGVDDPAVSYSVQEGARALDQVARGLFPLSAV